jgi:hypothetical protein
MSLLSRHRRTFLFAQACRVVAFGKAGSRAEALAKAGLRLITPCPLRYAFCLNGKIGPVSQTVEHISQHAPSAPDENRSR